MIRPFYTASLTESEARAMFQSMAEAYAPAYRAHRFIYLEGDKILATSNRPVVIPYLGEFATGGELPKVVTVLPERLVESLPTDFWARSLTELPHNYESSTELADGTVVREGDPVLWTSPNGSKVRGIIARRTHSTQHAKTFEPRGAGTLYFLNPLFDPKDFDLKPLARVESPRIFSKITSKTKVSIK